MVADEGQPPALRPARQTIVTQKVLVANKNISRVEALKASCKAQMLRLTI
jgi:hypothetical protein